MNSRRLFTMFAAIIFLCFAGLNLYRLLFGFEITIAGHMIGGTISFFLMAASAAISIMLVKEAMAPARQ